MLLFLGFTLLAGAAFVACEVASLPSRERHQSVRRAATYGRFRRVPGTERLHFRERVVAPASESLAAFVLRLNPHVTVESVRVRLLAAGVADKLTPTAFLAAKGALAGGGLLFGALVGFPTNAGSGLLLTLFGALVGFFVPDLLLMMRARARREQVRAELPDALDLHPRDHPGRPARHLARPHPPRAGRGHAPAPSGGSGGEGDEGADQDALPA